MDESKAKVILESSIQEDGDLYLLGWYLAWTNGDKNAILDGEFSAEELKAIAWWMENMDKGK